MKTHFLRTVLGMILIMAWTLSAARGYFLWYEDFETDGQGTRYRMSGGALYYSGANHYFTRVMDRNGIFPGGGTPTLDLDSESVDGYSWFTGQWYFAAESTATSTNVRVFDWANINLQPHLDVQFDGDFGAGSNGTTPSYGSDDFIAVLYSNDWGVNFLPGLVFRFDGKGGATSGRPMAQVRTIAPSGENGINTLQDLGNQLATGRIVPADDPSSAYAFIARDAGQAAAGPLLSNNLKKFTFGLPAKRWVCIRLVFSISGENVEIAFDNFTIHGVVRVTNHPPSVVNVFAPRSTVEDGDYHFAESDFDIGFRDPDPGDGLQVLRINSLPESGSLVLGAEGEKIDRVPFDVPRDQIGDLVYIPKANFGGPADRFRWYASDGENFAPIDGDFILNITETNDRPRPGLDVIDRLSSSSLEIPVATLLANDGDPLDHPPDLPLTLRRVHYTGGNGASVALRGDTIHYDPNGYEGDDTFIYELEDSRGARFSNALVTLHAIGAGDPVLAGPSLSISEVDLAGGAASIEIEGIPGRVYRLQAADNRSPDPVGWFDLPGGTVVADDEGRIRHLDPGPLPPARIYRAVHP